MADAERPTEGSAGEEGAYDALSRHPRAPDLAAIARKVMSVAAESRRGERRPEEIERLAAEVELTREAAATEFGNALDVLGRGPEDDAERALACALAAHSLALSPPKDKDDRERAATELLWLATHTPFDATGLLDRALGDEAADLWVAIADRVRRIDGGTLPALGRGEALLAAVALSSSRAGAARRQVSALAAGLRDPKLVLALRTRGSEAPALLVGELAPVPRSPLTTALMALTGLLFVLRGARLLGRIVLALKKPAEIAMSEDGGVRLKWRVELLGRTLRERDVVVPRAALVRVVREVRYPRFAFYAGLLALAVGSYVGVSSLVDGLRAASPTLAAWGLAVVAVGVGLDFALSSLAPGVRGRCRVVFVPSRGGTLCVGDVEVSRADAFVARLARP